ASTRFATSAGCPSCSKRTAPKGWPPSARYLGRDSVRIAVVTTSYPAHPGDAAGHFVQSEVRELIANGHEVTVITPRVGDAALADRAAVVHRVDAGTLFGWPGARARLAAAPWRA